MSTPKMYSSFIPNGRAEHHLHSPVHQGLPLGDPELSLSQVGSESVQSEFVCVSDGGWRGLQAHTFSQRCRS